MGDWLIRCSSLLLLLTSCWTESYAQPNTVQLEHGNDMISNNTVLAITDIGDGRSGGNAIICSTQLTPCCANSANRHGDWLYPNGTEVPNSIPRYSFFRTRRDADNNGVLGAALLHRFDTTSASGIYGCVIPGADGMEQTLYVGLYDTSSNAATLDEISFMLTSDPAAQSVSFSLTCTSNGGPVSTMVWERDAVGVPESSTYPDLTNRTTATYTNVLQVMGRETGTYTCALMDGDALSLLASITVQAANPPNAVSATQTMTSGPILITWASPNAGGAEVTLYRIYYNSKGALSNVEVASTEADYSLDLSGDPLDDMMVTIRAESAQLPSELVTVNVTVMAPTTMVTTVATTTPEMVTTEAPLTISITPSGTNTAGETYSLECSVTVTGSNDTPTITWLGPMGNQVPSDMLNTTGSMSTLTFSPLSASHAGTYTCSATVGNATRTGTAEVTIQDPTITVRADAGLATPMAGSVYSLTCTVTGAERLTGSTMTYQWFKDGMMVSDQTMGTFSFTPLSFSDAGGYTCQATVMSNLLSGPITTNSSNTEGVTLTFPAPSSVTVTSDQANPLAVRPVGMATVTLTCTVVLDSSVDVPVTVNTVWTGPDNLNRNIMAQQMGSTTTYTSTVMVSSFGRDQSGDYTCTATVSSASPFIMNSMSSSSTRRVTVGVYLSLKGMIYASNSVFSITEIGVTDTSTDNALKCVTDRMPCCSTDTVGQWFFPDGSQVSDNTSSPFYRSRGDDDGTVNLNRLNAGVMEPAGQFRCDVPDANGMSQTLYANIIDIAFSITPSGTNTAGETYRLVCSVTVTGSTDTPTITWLDPMGNQVSPDMLNTTGSMSTLTFSPLSASHAGTYTCRGTVEGVMESEATTVSVNNPNITVMLSGLGATPLAGQNFSLMCTVVGADSFSVAYQWQMNGSNLTAQTGSSLFLPSLSLSDAGQYSCQVSVSSVLFSQDLVASSNRFQLTMQIPAPTSVVVTGSSDFVIVGSSLTLTCTVDLPPSVDIPVTVMVVWSDTVDSTTPVAMVNSTRYTSTAVFNIDSSAADNQTYTCMAFATSESPNLNNSEMATGDITIVIVGAPSTPTNVMADGGTTSIDISWQQAEGDVVERYEITYNFNVNARPGLCTRSNTDPVTVELTDGSSNSYTLTNSMSTPVEEDGVYNISITAINSAGRSTPANVSMINTGQAAPGVSPEDLRAVSVDLTNITIGWDRIDCLQRNGIINQYRVFFYPTSGSRGNNPILIVGTDESVRMYTAVGLPPRTSYTFEVEAVNGVLLAPSPAAIQTVTTSVPQTVGVLLRGRLYGNHDIVTLESIGEGDQSLLCVTNEVNCCRGSDTGGNGVGEWYFPGDGSMVGTSNGGGSIYRNRGPSVVRLNRRNNAMMPTGVFRCEVPDASGTNQNIYVGVYSPGVGSPSIRSLLLNRTTTSLICTSTQGPATTVSWRKDGVLVNSTLFQQSQRVMDTMTATYENILFSDDIANFVGNFTCSVVNNRGMSESTADLNGVFIISDDFNIGQSASVTCFSDDVASVIEWIRDEVVLESDTSTKQLPLTFSQVNDSIHGNMFICRVTREGGGQAQQVFFPNVIVPPMPVRATVDELGNATAGQILRLTCTANKTVDGLLNQPTATWLIGATPVTDGDDIMVTTDGSTSTLTFNPLKTSHASSDTQVYTCEASIDSPALNQPRTMSVTQTLSVKITTPVVVIPAPSGTLYAGTRSPLTLNCSIAIDPAVDEPVTVTATWLREGVELSNSDSRLNISSTSITEPPFTSTLTLNPLSTVDNATFSCRAVGSLSGGSSSVQDSDPGEGTTFVLVTTPPPPVVTIVNSSSSASAGMSFNLTCSAVAMPDNLIGRPTLRWEGPGVGQEGVEEISEGDALILSLSALRTSHSGVYTCTARLMISEAQVDVSGSSMTVLTVQIPPPSLSITGSPRDRNFFQGLDLTLTCRITLNAYVDTPVVVDAMFLVDNENLANSNDDRVTVISRTDMSPYYIDILFKPLNVTHAGVYVCRATVVPAAARQDYIIGTTNSLSRNISVSGFPPQNATVFHEGDFTAASSNYVLVCSVEREEDLSNTSTLAVEWLDPRGNVISDGSNFTISDAGPTTNSTLTSRLYFNSLYTSQAGNYTCRSLLTIPGTVTDNPFPVTFTVNVKLPAPQSVEIEQSRDSVLYEGTSFSLVCRITPNVTGVDTSIMIQRTFSGLEATTTNRITLRNDANMSTLNFYPLAMTDNGTYLCSSSIISTSQYPYVVPSDQTENNTMIEIETLPPPAVTTSATPSPTAGLTHQLNCYATVPEFTVAVPVLEWVSLGNSAGITTPTQVNGTTSANRSLNFDPLRTSHGGMYTCRATLNIPRADIVDRSNNSSESVVVQIPSSTVSITKGPYPPYNGTVFNLTCEIDLDVTIVDTNVMIVWVWSTDGREVYTESTTSPSARQIIITFNPLATNSSGVYYLNSSILPTENSDYITPNNESSTSYTLMVEALPAPVVSTAITSRSGDICSEAMTLTCTATTVVNVFAMPTITWLFRGSPVPSSGNDPMMNSSTGQLVFNDISSINVGMYTCRASLTIPEAGITDHYNETSRTISTDQPDPVVSFKCQGMSASILFISWDKPGQVGSGIVGYRVEVREVQHVRDGSQELVSVPLMPVYNREVKEMRTEVNQGLVGAVPYNVTVEAVNIAGCGDQVQQVCFTEEGEPPMPRNVTVERVNNTAITVRWNKLTLVELKGFAMYIITYTTGTESKKRQLISRMATALYNESSRTIGGLPSGAKVDVQVHTSSSGGMSAPVTSTVEPVPSGIDGATIGGAIVAVVLVAVLLVIIIIIVIIIVKRRRSRKTFSPGHMYDVGGKAGTEERELHPVTNNQPSSAAIDKEKEAFEESAAIAPSPVPRSAITTEVLDRMKPVSLASFRDHVAMRHEDRDKGFETEYQSFGTEPVNVHDIAKQPINRPKNRFANIFPYDFSRVTLCEIPGEESSDYINACTIDGYKRSQCYIAAQGPMPNTINDFWRMVWEKRMPNIVMLTKCLEAGRRKCEQYWADNIGEDYMTPDKKLNITTTSVMPYADFVIRTFAVKSLTDATLDPLTVTHYHFTSWPDHGVPKFATSLISFIRRVQRGHTKDSGRQLLVHCSAGVGRTGTFITLDSMLDRMAAKEADVNVYEFVYNMRQRRVLMVQTLAQYVFIHDALNELITCGQTDIVASALRTKVNFLSKVIPAKGITGFQNQFQLLEQVSRVPVDEDITDAMESYNQSKNRYPDRVPYNMSRARLRPTGEDGSEYINASFIDGYKQRNAYIATQGPLQHTVNDIWRMLYEFKSRTMVMLCNMNEAGGEAAYPFFPSKEEEPVKYGKMLVTLQSKAAYTDFIVRKFSIQEDKQSSPKNDGFVVTQFHLTEWAPDGVTNTGTLIEMLDMITKNQMNTGNRPITVMCNDGVGRTGTFICIHAQLERLKTEGVVDFFQSIKSARIQRAGLVPDVDQYAFCHTVLADYIDKFDNYANFKDMI